MPTARKRNAAEVAGAAEAAGPRDVFTLEVIDGPAKGAVYSKQVRYPSFTAGSVMRVISLSLSLPHLSRRGKNY